jgi:hypothetical protein
MQNRSEIRTVIHALFVVLCVLLVGCSSDSKPGAFSEMGYHVRKTKVWLKSPRSGMEIYAVNEVVGADPKTFQSKELSNQQGATYLAGIDAKNVFVGEKRVEGADIASFEYIGAGYFKDKNAGYHFENRITSDAKNFVFEDEFARDSKNVYFGGNVFSEDAKRFARVGKPGSHYYKDSAKCWYSIHELEGADPSTLRYLGKDYAADRERVYYQMNVVTGADAGSFRILKQLYSRDKQNVYYQTEPIDGADPESFRVLDERYGVDNDHCFFYGGVLNGADPKTFQPLDPFYAKDAKHVWINGNAIEGADPATFQVIDGPAGKSRDAKHQYDMDQRLGGENRP